MPACVQRANVLSYNRRCLMNDNRTINTNEGYCFEALRRLAGQATAREFLLVEYSLEKRQARPPRYRWRWQEFP